MKENDSADNNLDTSASAITAHLNLANVDTNAINKAYELVEHRMKLIAMKLMEKEASQITVQKTMLVNDAYLKLVGHREWSDREEFFCFVVRQMRQNLVDHYRKRSALKRGGDHKKMSLDQIPEGVDSRSIDPHSVVELNDLISTLEDQHPEPFKVFNLHYFGRWELKEIAEDILKIPYVRVLQLWKTANDLLKEKMNE